MRYVLTLLTVFALAGCAGIPRPTSVHTGEAQSAVRAQLGAPATERKFASGETAWYYVTGPSSYFTWRVVFGSDGRVKEYAQVLTMQNFYAVQQGQSRDAVLDRLGPPMQKMTFARTGTESWTYRWLDGTFQMLADATFSTGSGEIRQVTTFLDPAYHSASYE